MSSLKSVEINSFWAAFGMDKGVWMIIKQKKDWETLT